jgi:glycosyltransferase involved in cell wall biosynthesis
VADPASRSWPGAPPRVVPNDELPAQPPVERVRVLHVITRLAGGSGDNTLTSAVGMDPARYEVWVAAAPGGTLWEDAARQGVHTVVLPHLRERIAVLHDLSTLWTLRRLMRRERFTVVHTHCAKAGLLGRLAARLSGVPVVVHTYHALAVHEFMSGGRRVTYLWLERSVRRLAHRYVAVAPTLARQAVEHRLVPPGTIRVVPSGIDPPLHVIGSSWRRELGIGDSAPVIGTVGRFVAQKAPLDFVRMAARVQASRPEAVFVMVGDAALESRSLEEATRAEAARLGVTMVFTGFRADAAALAANFDVYVVPSLYEGLGRALTEAMASGRPVVATNVNGVPDLVAHGSTGLLATPGDPTSLARSVLWCLDHPQAAGAMGRQGSLRVSRAFSAARMCAALDELYGELLGQPATAPTVGIPSRLGADRAETRARSTSSGVGEIRHDALPTRRLPT